MDKANGMGTPLKSSLFHVTREIRVLKIDNHGDSQGVENLAILNAP